MLLALQWVKVIAGKAIGGAVGSAAGEVLDPFKKGKDKNPVAAAAGGAAGGAISGGAIGAAKKAIMKNSYQSEGELVDEAKMEKGYISNLSKAQVRNQRKFGKKGSTTPQGYFGQKPSQAAELSKKRTDEHKAKRGVKKGMSEGTGYS